MNLIFSYSQLFMAFTNCLCVYLLTIAGWTQNRSLNIKALIEGRRFDSYCSVSFIGICLTNRRIPDLSLGFELHLETALDDRHTHTHTTVKHVYTPSYHQ